ncbi:MAG: hypothetical protein ITF98_04440 [Fermentimonas sp.]|nr:hypothetical protein [Fermentimonas sp.]
MKKTAVLLIVILLNCFMHFVDAQNNKSSKNVWKYEVAQAPYGYEKGKLILTYDKDVLIGEVEDSSGYKIKMSEVSLVKDTLKGVVYIENERVRLKGNIKDSIIIGTVDTFMGVLKFKAIKEVSSK